MSEDYLIWDEKEHLFLVEFPYWNAGVWTRSANKAMVFPKVKAELYVAEANAKGSKLKAWEKDEAHRATSTKIYVTRKII